MKDTPPLDDRVTALRSVIDLLRNLDVESQLRVLNAVVVFMGFTGTVLRKPTAQDD